MRAGGRWRTVVTLSVALLVMLGSFTGQALGDTPNPEALSSPGKCLPGVPCPREPYAPGEGDPTKPPPLPDTPEPAAAGAVSPQSSGGPDEFGYTWTELLMFSWIDATVGTNTGLAGDDTHTGPIDIGFDFKFYESTYSQVYVSTNGLLTFGQGFDHYQNTPVPYPAYPNSLVAAFWDDLCVNYGGYNTGAIYYLRQGTAPNRSLTIEWYRVSRTGSSDLLTFEVVLYENGNIDLQYFGMSGNLQSATVGIEDGNGTTGLQYLYKAPGMPSSNAVRFSRPAPAARVAVWPLRQGGFAHAGEAASSRVVIRNTGQQGPDTYDLTVASPWPVALYAADGSTLLTDTDHDGTVDTGALAEGHAITVTAKVTAPGTARLGDANIAAITVASSIESGPTRTVFLESAVPAPFSQIYADSVDAATTAYLVRPHMSAPQKVGDPYGSDLAVAEAPNGDIACFWRRTRYLGPPHSFSVEEIEYALLDRDGAFLRQAGRLADHSSAAMPTFDRSPAVAIAPNGRIGVLWYRDLYNSSTYQHNYNMYLAILDSSGTLVYGPANLTNNSSWGTSGSYNVPVFQSPRIAATDDNRFVLAWTRTLRTPQGYLDDIYYAVESTDGAQVMGITGLTADTAGATGYSAPALAPISPARAIVSWFGNGTAADDIFYAVLSSSGALVKSSTRLSEGATASPTGNYDAVELSNGRILLAWPAVGCPGESSVARISYAILDSAYNRVAPPACLAGHPTAQSGDAGVSVAADGSGNAILTWTDSDPDARSKLYYALVGSDGTVRTPPMIFHTAGLGPSGAYYLTTSFEGYGNTSYTPLRVFLPLVLR